MKFSARTSKIEQPTSDVLRRGRCGFMECSMLDVGHWVLLLLFLCLSGGFVNEVFADGPSVVQTNAPQLRVFSESEVLALLTVTLQNEYVKDRGELELNLKQPWVVPILPDEPLTVKFLELPTVGVIPSFIVRFQLCTENQSLGTWQATLQAHVWREVWVAHSNLMRGTPVNGADIVRERFDVLNVREPLAEFAADNANLELAEPVASGLPLVARMVKPRTVIHRGQIANALLQDGALSITTKVEALEDGAPGQMIRARNPVSRRDLNGQVLDGQTILISL